MNPLSGTEAAEERFKEVVKSYEAIKLERKNGWFDPDV
jgi:DnaJ-class molecular chaperone